MTVSRLKGRVMKVTFRRLKNGKVRHWTRVEFDPALPNAVIDQPFRSVSLSGEIPWGHRPELRLLEALQERYDVPSLPEPKWSGE